MPYSSFCGYNIIDTKDEIYNNTLLWKYDN